MRGVRGDRWARFTVPDGNRQNLTALAGDFTNPAIDGKIPLDRRLAIDQVARNIGSLAL
jgi:hypothetical protein